MVTIVIPHVGDLKPLKRCVDSMRASILIVETDTGAVGGPSVDYEIIVVTDKPSPEVRQYLKQQRQRKDLRVITNPKPVGTEAALNQGWRKAKGNYLMFLMTDVELVPGAVDALQGALEDHPEWGWVALSSEHTGFLAGCSLFTRDVWEKVGPWDEDFVSGGGFSDDDFLRRAWLAGYQPHIVSRPQVKHLTTDSATFALLGAGEKTKRFRRNQELFRKKWGQEGTDWNALPRYEPEELHRIDWVKSRVKLTDKILEVGSAENPIWKDTPFKVITLDISVRPEENCFPDVVGNAEALPFPDGSFDVVTLGELLEHVENPQQVLQEATRVGRKVLITVPAEHLWAKALKPFWNPSHVRFYTKGTFEEELKALGLPYRMQLLKFKYWRHFVAEIFKDKVDMTYPKELKDFFESDRYWSGDWGYRQGYQDFPIHEQIVDLIRSRHPKSVLDVGCAYGFIPLRLRKKGVEAWGIDISQYAIAHAPEEVKPYVKVGSAHEIPFPDGSVDLIYCASVLEHIPENLIDKVIAEFQRVAKRAIVGIAYRDPSTALDIHSDITHVNIHTEQWWRQKLPKPFFEMLDVCVEDKKVYSRGKTKINLGAFGDFYPAWQNYDILPLRGVIPPHIPFRQWDLRQGIPHPDNSVDLVRCSHLIEHLTLEEAHSFLREVYRVLVPGGLARISTPDLDIILRHYRNHNMVFFNPIQPLEYITAPTEGEKLSRLLYSGDYSHRAVYNDLMLKAFLEQAGFTKVFRSVVGFSHSEEIQMETVDTHPEISLLAEAVK